MEIVKLILASTLILFIALAGMGIKLYFDKKAVFKAGSCGNLPEELDGKGYGCACGGDVCENN